MIKLLIFDLDNTLFDTHGQLRIRVYRDMIRNMRKAGLTSEQEKAIMQRYVYTSFIVLVRELNLPEEVKKMGFEVYKKMDLSHIKPYDDVKLIKGFKQKKILVTSGLKDIQMKKVEILKIRDLFEEMVVDESSSPKNKQRIFADMMKKHNLKPDEVMVIGDNPDSEIAAGNALGMVTLQVMRSTFRRGEADYHINDFLELKKILKGVNK